jgi:hypothetical protein
MTNTRVAHRTGRHLILIDIENLVGSSSPTSSEVEAALQALSNAVPGFDSAQRVVACSHHAACAVSFAASGCRRLWRSGPNGADLALLEVLNSEFVEERFEFITVCSGDGIFADSVARLSGQGVVVNVVPLKGQVARRLRPFAHHIHSAPLSVATTYRHAG